MAARAHDHGRRDDRAARRRHADFVDPGDPLDTGVPEASLVV
jgi:hypothetical protein